MKKLGSGWNSDESLLSRSPFELSGGQMRRVAIAGILAMEPAILVLDEPTAGLDPLGRKELMNLFKNSTSQGMTIILVTHLMDDVAEYANQVYVMEKGRLVKGVNQVMSFKMLSLWKKCSWEYLKLRPFVNDWLIEACHLNDYRLR